MASANPAYSGYQRQRKTRLSVRLGEVISRQMITLGGIGTIISIVLVFVFLVWVTIPLFMNAKAKTEPVRDVVWSSQPLLVGVDTEQLVSWSFLSDGSVATVRLDTGEIIATQKILSGAAITAISPQSRSDTVLVGLADGTIRLGKISISSQVLDESRVKSEIKALTSKQSLKHDGGLIVRQENGSLVLLKTEAVFDPEITVASGQNVKSVDITIRPNGPILCSLTTDGILRINEVHETKNLITGKVKRDLYGGEYKITARSIPDRVLINGVGDNVMLVWNDGTLQRINTKKIEEPFLEEEVKLTRNGANVTALQFMIGKETLLVGDSLGAVRAWFVTRSKGSKLGDESRMEMAHEFPGIDSKVTALASSARSRVLAASYADGSVRLYYLTNEVDLLTLKATGPSEVGKLLLAPKEDGLIAWNSKGIESWKLQLGHPEISYRSLIRPVWYEGYGAPAHVWQSSSGDDAFEPKFGLWPLVFGTLKATFYSLLIAVPLALCAAIYTREFLSPKVRGVVKPTIEVMASLPSVVLGFLGALIIAPFVESALSIVLVSIIVIPLGFAIAGFLWHMLPSKWIRLLQSMRFYFILMVMPITIYLSALLAPVWESVLFDGSIKRWLSQTGVKSASGWLLLLLPLAAVGMLVINENFINPWIRLVSRKISASREAWLNMIKCVMGIVLTFGISWVVAQMLAGLGLDPRSNFFGIYDQRNALVVGIMMGFAIIPIIYTLAEDALSSVPDHLRSASLGCGATTWQTAARIVIPTAMSGIFSAIMVGLGRAVGETMIVLMAAGNVPVLDMNIFNGFRTLSANIAVELPEAVQGSTHYRTLFLAALTLFVFTFLLNTLAESMRQRFRKRAFEL